MHEVCLAFDVACVQRVSTNASMIACGPFCKKPVKPLLPQIALTKAGVVLGHVVAQRNPMPVVEYSFPV